MKRNDIHSPSSVNPERYTWLDSIDLSDGEDRDAQHRVLQRLSDGSPHGNYDQCAHCGAWLTYVAVMAYHDPGTGTGYLVPWGHDCLETLSMLEDAADARLRQLKLARQRRQAADRNREAREQFAQDQPDVYTLLTMALRDPTDHLDFVCDVARRFDREPHLSDRQLAALERCVQSHEKFARAKAHRERQEAKRLAVAKPVPWDLGRFADDYRVVSTDVRESDYGIRYVMLVEHRDGWRLWGTAPDAVFSDIRDDLGPRKHTHVRFACRVSVSDDDPTFGFIERPTRAHAFTPMPEQPADEPQDPDTPF